MIETIMINIREQTWQMKYTEKYLLEGTGYRVLKGEIRVYRFLPSLLHWHTWDTPEVWCSEKWGLVKHPQAALLAHAQKESLENCHLGKD